MFIVSDVFHTGSPESPLWEFKHGNGNFKRGDLQSLREIKRRASRHALIHRDSFSTNPRPNVVSQPGTPADPPPDSLESRLAHFEHMLFEMSTRLARCEESNSIMSSRNQALIECLARCHQVRKLLMMARERRKKANTVISGIMIRHAFSWRWFQTQRVKFIEIVSVHFFPHL